MNQPMVTIGSRTRGVAGTQMCFIALAALMAACRSQDFSYDVPTGWELLEVPSTAWAPGDIVERIDGKAGALRPIANHTSFFHGSLPVESRASTWLSADYESVRRRLEAVADQKLGQLSASVGATFERSILVEDLWLLHRKDDELITLETRDSGFVDVGVQAILDSESTARYVAMALRGDLRIEFQRRDGASIAIADVQRVFGVGVEVVSGQQTSVVIDDLIFAVYSVPVQDVGALARAIAKAKQHAP